MLKPPKLFQSIEVKLPNYFIGNVTMISKINGNSTYKYYSLIIRMESDTKVLKKIKKKKSSLTYQRCNTPLLWSSRV